MKVFVDTSALLAILDSGDLHHADSTRLLERLLEVDELVTHNYVHVEAEALVHRRLGRDAAGDLVDRLLAGLTTVWVDGYVHHAAVEAWRARGRRLSLVDEVSFVVMRQSGITQAFAYDGDFEAEGFGRPTRPEPGGRRLSEEEGGYGSEPASDVVSVTEIAKRAGRSVSTVQSWRRRKPDFPAPVVELAAGPIWSWAEVERWIERRARPARPKPTGNEPVRGSPQTGSVGTPSASVTA